MPNPWQLERKPLAARSSMLLHSDIIVEELRPAGSDAASASTVSAARYVKSTTLTSPYNLSPRNPAVASALARSPWIKQLPPDPPSTGLVGSLVCREGHVYSLAASGDLLYTGSVSGNIRVWKGRQELSCFRSRSGLVKAIVVAGDSIFTGHRDGKIRVWRTSSKDRSVHKRVGTLPTLGDFLRSSMIPSNYVEVRRHRRLRHLDAVSCLSLDEDAGMLYSGSWDKTVKVWRISDSKCLESFNAHDDAVNAVAAGFDGLLFTGSADGTLKAWRRDVAAGGKRGGGGGATRHVVAQTLLLLEGAVTAVVVATEAGAVYCGSSDGLVCYWRRERGGGPLALGGALRGHGMAVLCLAAAGSIVASGSADRTVRVWRREEGGGAHIAVAVFAGHVGPIKCLAVVEEEEEEEERVDGMWYVVYSGSLDKSVKIWRVAEQEREREREAARSAPQHVRVGAGGDWPRRSPLHVW